jgi:hypothetical protein
MKPALYATSEEYASCYVCGKDCHEAWFTRIHEQERKVCLCGPGCALAYFDVPNPPPHDHQARHEYNRIRAAVLEAARAVSAGACQQFDG